MRSFATKILSSFLPLCFHLLILFCKTSPSSDTRDRRIVARYTFTRRRRAPKTTVVCLDEMNTSNVLPSDHSQQINVPPSNHSSAAQQTSESVSVLESHVEDHYPHTTENEDPAEIGGGFEGIGPRPVRFKIRIADLDYYMVEPGPLDIDSCQFLPSACPVLKVPVVRVYGANEAGQKTCLHIHQVSC